MQRTGNFTKQVTTTHLPTPALDETLLAYGKALRREVDTFMEKNLHEPLIVAATATQEYMDHQTHLRDIHTGFWGTLERLVTAALDFRNQPLLVAATINFDIECLYDRHNSEPDLLGIVDSDE